MSVKKLDELVSQVLDTEEYDRSDVWELAELARKHLGANARAQLRLSRERNKLTRERLRIRAMREARLAQKCAKCGADTPDPDMVDNDDLSELDP